MDLFHFELISDIKLNMEATVTHDLNHLTHKNKLLVFDTEIPKIKIYDTFVTEGPVTVACYLKVARHVQ